MKHSSTRTYSRLYKSFKKPPLPGVVARALSNVKHIEPACGKVVQRPLRKAAKRRDDWGTRGNEDFGDADQPLP
jgi:hypothetical protein